jgi:hypothetical protein
LIKKLKIKSFADALAVCAPNIQSLGLKSPQKYLKPPNILPKALFVF